MRAERGRELQCGGTDAGADGVHDGQPVLLPERQERAETGVQTETGAEVDEDAVAAWVGERLARFKHPRLIAFVDALPRNAMGKVTKPALRPLTQETPA